MRVMIKIDNIELPDKPNEGYDQDDGDNIEVEEPDKPNESYDEDYNDTSFIELTPQAGKHVEEINQKQKALLPLFSPSEVGFQQSSLDDRFSAKFIR